MTTLFSWRMLTCAGVIGLAIFYAHNMQLAHAAVDPDQAMPAFQLKDLNGADHKLDEFKGKITVIEFCSINCPFSRGSDANFIELSKQYADKGVSFIGIYANAGEKVDDIKKYAAEKGKNYTLLRDEGAKFADVVGAKVTPDVFVVDKDGKLAYHGAFDNRTVPETKGSEPYTQKAIDALLAGKPVETKSTKPWGCGIKH